MDWTSIYLKTSSLKVFILGAGEVATRRANKFLDHGANVKIIGNHLPKTLKDRGVKSYPKECADELVKWADLVIVASGNKKLSEYVSKIAKNKLINRADYPKKGNIIVPTSFNIGNIEISIFTKGKSPLMAKQIRKKIQAVITEEDILEIELQDYSRVKLKKYIKNQKQRREYLYEIFKNEKINNYIKNRQTDDAKKYIDNLIKGIISDS